MARLVRNSFDPERSGDFVITVAPGCLLSGYDSGTTHGTPHAYDRAIPLVFFGPGIAPAEVVTDTASVEPVVPGNINVRQLTDTTFAVLTFAGEVAADADFALSIFQLPVVT